MSKFGINYEVQNNWISLSKLCYRLHSVYCVNSVTFNLFPIPSPSGQLPSLSGYFQSLPISRYLPLFLATFNLFPIPSLSFWPPSISSLSGQLPSLSGHLQSLPSLSGHLQSLPHTFALASFNLFSIPSLSFWPPSISSQYCTFHLFPATFNLFPYLPSLFGHLQSLPHTFPLASFNLFPIPSLSFWPSSISSQYLPSLSAHL